MGKRSKRQLKKLKKELETTKKLASRMKLREEIKTCEFHLSFLDKIEGINCKELEEVVEESQRQSDKAGFLHNITENIIKMQLGPNAYRNNLNKEKKTKKETKGEANKKTKANEAKEESKPKETIFQEKESKSPLKEKEEAEEFSQKRESMMRFIATLADEMAHRNIVTSFYLFITTHFCFGEILN